jgi:uncharacterized protein (DUF433 family)
MQAVTVNKNVQGGLPCFTGTRVPVTSLFDHLQKGYTVAGFLADFPSVTEAQVQAVLETAKADAESHAARVETQ